MGPRKLEERERVGQNSGCAYLACTFVIGVPPTREMHGLVVGGSKSEENARYPENAEAKVGAAVCPPGHARILSGVHSTGEQGRSAEMNSTPRSSSGSRFVDQQSSRAQHRKKTKWRARTWNVLPTEKRRSSGKKKKLLLLSTCTSTAVYLAGNTFSIYHVGGSVVYRVQARLYLSGR